MKPIHSFPAGANLPFRGTAFAPELVGTHQASEGGGGRHCSPPLSKDNSSWRGSSGAGRCRRLLRRASERRRDWPSATRRRIGQALTLRALQGEIASGEIVDAERYPVIVTKIKLCRVAMQVGFADVEIAAIDAALEDRKEVFDRVGMPERGAHIFLGAVVDGAVSVEIASDSGINWRVVGHQIGRLIDVRDNDRLQALCGHVLHMKAADSLRIAADCYRLLPSNAGRGNLGRRLV
jgi:hypothetical protein